MESNRHVIKPCHNLFGFFANIAKAKAVYIPHFFETRLYIAVGAFSRTQLPGPLGPGVTVTGGKGTSASAS